MTDRVWQAALALMMLCGLVSGPAAAQWQPLPPDQARLVVLPGAFGTQSISRSYQQDEDQTWYEVWSMHLDPANRFFKFFLRESGPRAYVNDPMDLPRLVAEGFNNPDLHNIRFGEPRQMDVGLGDATVLPFTLGKIGCAAFHMDWGELRGAFPAHSLKGYYCDPLFPTVPGFDVRQTLDSIGVLGHYVP